MQDALPRAGRRAWRGRTCPVRDALPSAGCPANARCPARFMVQDALPPSLRPSCPNTSPQPYPAPPPPASLALNPAHNLTQHSRHQHSTAHGTAQHNTTHHNAAQHNMTQRGTIHSTAHSTAQHSIAQRNTAQPPPPPRTIPRGALPMEDALPGAGCPAWCRMPCLVQDALLGAGCPAIAGCPACCRMPCLVREDLPSAGCPA